MKRAVPLAIVMVGGILFIIQYFIPHQYSQTLFDYYTEWVPIVGAFTVILGVGSLTRLHKHKIKRKAPNWPYSWAVLIPLYAVPLFSPHALPTFAAMVVGIFAGLAVSRAAFGFEMKVACRNDRYVSG
mgnify:CR=1 FL=1